MTKGEAIDLCMEVRDYLTSGNPIWDKDKVGEALDMAIEALEGVCFDEWCDDCKEYDTEKKCCPRFNRVIRGAVADALEAVPPADRPRREWANDEHDMPRCSNCGYMPEFNKHIDDYYYSDFCPNCGAEMRGETNE